MLRLEFQHGAAMPSFAQRDRLFMGDEIELKLELSPADAARIVASKLFGEKAKVAEQVSTYFDTDKNPHSPSKSLILLSGSQYFRYKSWC
ncbi:hypothetical protein [Sphingomonas koreensis]|uniref:hypothetical protein n=1 Tax=Sphingomonas koreensis TaxID=93064 RepID=UPI0019D31600|nr:hypothetical protein [Sphingomonas koreensis]